MKYRMIYSLIVVGLTIYFCISSLFSLGSARSDFATDIGPSPLLAAKKAPAAVPPLDHYNIIIERNLFGGSQKQGAASQDDISPREIPLAQKNLGLKLVGTVVVDAPTGNIAIIENSGTRKQDAYQEGDKVGNGLIKKIVRNNVIIAVGTEEQRLTMEAEEDPEQSLASKKAIGSQKQAFTSFNPRIARAEVLSALGNIDKLMQTVRISPYVKNNESAGFKVTNIPSESILRRIGLRDGDVIRGVDKKIISSPNQAREFFERLVEGGDITLKVKRYRTTRALSLSIE